MQQADTNSGQSRVKSAERVLDIIEALAQHRHGLTFTELQRTLQLPKSSLHELLSVLTHRGYIEYDDGKRSYVLGIRILERGQTYLRHHDFIEESQKVMEHIVAQTNETAQLAILDGIENVYLAKVDSSHPLRLQSEVGGRLYAHATGVGKVLLAGLTPDEFAQRMPATLPRFTANTHTDPNTLEAELAEVRKHGFAVDAQEYTPGLACVAVPLYETNRVVAAMSVSMPITRITLPLLVTSLQLLAEGSLQIVRRRGGTDDRRLRQLLVPDAALHTLVPLFERMTRRLEVNSGIAYAAKG
jgi:DNA-binding IclR family transcriptional regulator